MIEEYKFNNILVNVEYILFEKSDLKYILNKLNGRFDGINMVSFHDYNSRLVEVVKLKNNAKEIRIYSYQPNSIVNSITANEKTRMNFNYFEYVKVKKTSDDEMVIYFFPYPDIYKN